MSQQQTIRYVRQAPLERAILCGVDQLRRPLMFRPFGNIEDVRFVP